VTGQGRAHFLVIPPSTMVEAMTTTQVLPSAQRLSGWPVSSADIRGFGRHLVEWVAPNWFAAVMGTGILATAAAGLPVGLANHLVVQGFAVGAWLLAALLLVGVSLITLAQWIYRPDLAHSHLWHPVRAHFYGAVPMALMTVGAGTLLAGPRLIGSAGAVRIDIALWTVGTLGGLLTTVAGPLLLVTGRLGAQARRPDAAFGGWLMPEVPPMVSASTGALLLPHCPAGQVRLTLLLSCYAMFGISLIASAVVGAQICTRLVRYGLPESRLVPTVWIVLGPLGQSVTAAVALGNGAFGLIYGLIGFGFALLWIWLAGAMTLRTARTGLPFAPTWWAFTFPVGTCVTAASALTRETGADVFAVFAVVLFAALLSAWLVVASKAVQSVHIDRCES
jgi:tellurite resistance protein TehA-like permease